MTLMFILCKGSLCGLLVKGHAFFFFASLSIAEEVIQISETVILVSLSTFIRHRSWKILRIPLEVLLKM